MSPSLPTPVAASALTRWLPRAVGPAAVRAVLRGSAAGFAVVVLAAGCLPKGDDPPAAPAEPMAYDDNFDRSSLGDRYLKSGGTWSIVEGQLNSKGERNLPLWLDVPLSKNLKVEFTTLSKSPAVDTKIEIFGDGERHESGYIVIMGGWNNTISTIAKLDEHQKARVEKRTRFNPNQRYRWRVQRTDGKTLELYIDDELVVAYEDNEPLFGPSHNKLGFTNWLSDVYYDDLKITPLP